MYVYIPTCTLEVLDGNLTSQKMGIAIILHDFSHTMTLFASWKTNFLQTLALFQATEDAWTWNIFPHVVFVVDVILEFKNLDTLFSKLKIAAFCFRCVETLYCDTSK